MKKIFFAFIFFFFTLQGHAGYDVEYSSTIPGNIIISQGQYDELISPLQGIASRYYFENLTVDVLCLQLIVKNDQVTCIRPAGLPMVLDIGSYPYIIYDEREPIPASQIREKIIYSIPSMISILSGTSSGSMSASGDIMATPFGSIVYFIIGIALLSVAIGVIFWISRKG